MSWLSKKFKKSKKKGTGIFSWGKSKVLTSGLKLIPGIGANLSQGAETFLVKGKGKPFSRERVSSKVRIKNV
jgi:hypothetical protein